MTPQVLMLWPIPGSRLFIKAPHQYRTGTNRSHGRRSTTTRRLRDSQVLVWYRTAAHAADHSRVSSRGSHRRPRPSSRADRIAAGELQLDRDRQVPVWYRSRRPCRRVSAASERRLGAPVRYWCGTQPGSSRARRKTWRSGHQLGAITPPAASCGSACGRQVLVWYRHRGSRARRDRTTASELRLAARPSGTGVVPPPRVRGLGARPGDMAPQPSARRHVPPLATTRGAPVRYWCGTAIELEDSAREQRRPWPSTRRDRSARDATTP